MCDRLECVRALHLHALHLDWSFACFPGANFKCVPTLRFKHVLNKEISADITNITLASTQYLLNRHHHTQHPRDAWALKGTVSIQVITGRAQWLPPRPFASHHRKVPRPAPTRPHPISFYATLIFFCSAQTAPVTFTTVSEAPQSAAIADREHPRSFCINQVLETSSTNPFSSRHHYQVGDWRAPLLEDLEYLGACRYPTFESQERAPTREEWNYYKLDVAGPPAALTAAASLAADILQQSHRPRRGE